MRRAWLCAFVLIALAAAPAQATVPVGLADQHAARAARRARGVARDHLRARRRAVGRRAGAVRRARRVAPDRARARAGRARVVRAPARRGLPPRALPTTHRGRTACRVHRVPHPLAVGGAFGAWNEGNHASQPTADDPAGAARLYETLAAACAECRILAAELLDIAEHAGVAAALPRRAAQRAAAVGAAQLRRRHPRAHGDDRGACSPRSTAACGSRRPAGSSASSTRRRALAVRRGARAGEPGPQPRSWPSRTPTGSSALYVYQWQAAAHEPWDSGLIRPDFSPRPSFTELAAWLRPPAPAAAAACCRRRSRRARERAALRLVRRPWFSPAAGPCARASTARRAAPRRAPCGRGPRRPRGRSAARLRRAVLRPGPTATLAVRLPARAAPADPAAAHDRVARRGQRRDVWRQRFVVAAAGEARAAAVIRHRLAVGRAARLRARHARLRRGLGAGLGQRDRARRAARPRRRRARRRRTRSRSSSRRVLAPFGAARRSS